MGMDPLHFYGRNIKAWVRLHQRRAFQKTYCFFSLETPTKTKLENLAWPPYDKYIASRSLSASCLPTGALAPAGKTCFPVTLQSDLNEPNLMNTQMKSYEIREQDMLTSTKSMVRIFHFTEFLRALPTAGMILVGWIPDRHLRRNAA